VMPNRNDAGGNDQRTARYPGPPIAPACQMADNGCNPLVGCRHGQFSRPSYSADSTFAVNGTYRIEVGPISMIRHRQHISPGSVTGPSLMLTSCRVASVRLDCL
jgi:hypothetical protein